MHRTVTAFAATLALTGMALAHANTKDPTVKAWMANMKAIADETKTIGQMVRNQAAFDADAANASLSRIAGYSADIPVLFSEKADDPTSEARDLIWSDWPAFEKEAARLTDLTGNRAVASPDELRLALTEIGATCKSCHGTYRD